MVFRLQTICIFAVMVLASSAMAQDYKSGIEWQEPPIVTPGATDDQPPSDATVLFDGTDMSAWHGGPWKIENGEMVVSKGSISTKEQFGDIQLHLEWSAPTEVKGTGQGRGNSGVFLMGRYEVQVLDNFDNQTYFDGQAASVYKQTPPMANAMRKPGEWNTYDIFWTAPRFGVDTKLVSPAKVTVVHNGICVLNGFELYGPTNFSGPPEYKVHGPKGPIQLQDHGNPVRFRNIWVRELKPAVGHRVGSPYVKSGGQEMSVEAYEAKRANQRNGKSRAEEQKKIKQMIQKAVDEAVKKEREASAKKQDQEEEAARVKESPRPTVEDSGTTGSF